MSDILETIAAYKRVDVAARNADGEGSCETASGPPLEGRPALRLDILGSTGRLCSSWRSGVASGGGGPVAVPVACSRYRRQA